MNYNRRNSVFGDVPVMFKIVFGIQLVVILSIMGLIGYGIFSVVSDPALIGRIAGQVVNGYNSVAK